MSFLLDALSKADDDRRRSEVPELKTYNQGRHSPLRGVVRGLALLCLLSLFFTFGYFLRPYLETTWFEQGQVNLSNQSLQATKSQPEVVGRVYALEVISYSDSPASRFVMIGGVLVHEGEMLDTGEKLILIEPNAMVLEKEGRPIRVSF